MEEEREGFVKDSKVAIKGAINGIFGSLLYEILISLFISTVISMNISLKNPNETKEGLKILIDSFYDSFPFSILISCIGSIIALIVFVVIIKFENFKEICKKAINIKTIKYGIICAFCIMGFSVLYNSSIVLIFNLSDGGNSNQENVIELIKSNVFLGFLAAVILAPIVEELTFRYCLFGGVCKKKKWLGYLISGVVFAFVHFISSIGEFGFSEELLIELLYLPPYLFSGLALCYVYDKSNNLGSSVIGHMLNNLISFLGIVLL